MWITPILFNQIWNKQWLGLGPAVRCQSVLMFQASLPLWFVTWSFRFKTKGRTTTRFTHRFKFCSALKMTMPRDFSSSLWTSGRLGGGVNPHNLPLACIHVFCQYVMWHTSIRDWSDQHFADYIILYMKLNIKRHGYDWWLLVLWRRSYL